MRKWLIFWAVCFAVLPVPGCGSGRPDPRDNPSFNEQAVDPANAARPGVTPDSTAPAAKP